jgi:hypothetical protein
MNSYFCFRILQAAARAAGFEAAALQTGKAAVGRFSESAGAMMVRDS